MGLEIKARARRVSDPRPIRIVEHDLRDTRFAVPEEWVIFAGVTFERVDLRGARFRPFGAQASTFIDCDFTGAKFSTGSFGSLGRSVYRNCRFERADLRGITLVGNARFERCSFVGAKIEGWRADCAEFVDCVFGGRLRDCRFAGRPWTCPGDVGRDRNDFRGNDFRAAELDGVMFVYGIDLAAQRLPEGPEYIRLDRLAARIGRARAIIARWPDDTARERAFAMLRIYSEDGYAEQRELFTRRSTVKVLGPELVEQVWALLAEPLA